MDDNSKPRVVMMPGRKKKHRIPFQFAPIPTSTLDSGVYWALPQPQQMVYTYICRKTYGFGKTADAIPLAQFTDGITTKDGTILQAGLPLCRRTVISSLQSLEAAGWIKVSRTHRKPSVFSPQIPPAAAYFEVTETAPMEHGKEAS